MAYTTPYTNAIQQRRVAARRNVGMARPNTSMSAAPVSGDPSSFLSNLDYGQILSAATGGAQLASNVYGMANESLGIETQAPGQEFSATGEPVYNVGSFYNQAIKSQPQGVTGGEVIGGALQGAGAGSTFGVPGMLIGGAVGALGSVFGGSRRKKKQREERRRAVASATQAQKNFNQASSAYDETQAAQADYYNRLDMSDRFYNLYK